jgi:hypothetical protein
VPQATLFRLVAAFVVVWIVIGLIALVLFHWGGTHPPSRGKGDPIGLSPLP